MLTFEEKKKWCQSNKLQVYIVLHGLDNDKADQWFRMAADRGWHLQHYNDNATVCSHKAFILSRIVIASNIYCSENIGPVVTSYSYCSCFASSPRRPDREYKRMVFEHTHGLFIT